MPSRTIRPTQAPVDAPFVYTVSAADGFTPEAMFVSWDGSGAFGDFLPCVSYYNSEGVLLDRAFPDTGAVTAGDTAEVGYRPFKRGGGGGGGPPTPALITSKGATVVNPTLDLVIGANMTLVNAGGGNALIAAAAAPAQPSLLLAFYNVLSPQDALVPGSFPVTVGVSNGNRPGVTGGQARFQFAGGAFRMVVRGEIWNNTLSTIDAKLSVDVSIGPAVPELPVETNALSVPPGGTGTLPPIYLDIHPTGLSVAYLDYGTTISGGGVSITGVQLIGDIEFRPI